MGPGYSCWDCEGEGKACGSGGVVVVHLGGGRVRG